jgi:hypothetical protein
MTNATADLLIEEIAMLAKVEYLVETNEGTFGGADPAYATRRVYETVAGTRRETGPSESNFEGYMRSLNRDALAADRKRMADLNRKLRGGK